MRRPNDLTDRELLDKMCGCARLSGRNAELKMAAWARSDAETEEARQRIEDNYNLLAARFRGRLLCRLKKMRVTIPHFRGTLHRQAPDAEGDDADQA